MTTIGYVGATKRLDRRYSEHFARELAKLVKDRFDDNQTKAAKYLGISQPHLSHLIAAEGRGPGLSVLLRVREATDRSIDELLGLPPPAIDALTKRLEASFELEVARFRAEASQKLEEARVIAATTGRRKKRGAAGEGRR